MASSQPAGVAAWREFLDYHSSVVYKIEEALHKADCIPLAWYDILVELEFASGYKMRQKDLALACKLTKSGISRTLSTLEKNKMIERLPDPADGRGTYAFITTKGRAARKKAWPVYAACIRKWFQLSGTEYKQLEKVFTKLTKALHQDD